MSCCCMQVCVAYPAVHHIYEDILITHDATEHRGGLKITLLISARHAQGLYWQPSEPLLSHLLGRDLRHPAELSESVEFF